MQEIRAANLPRQLVEDVAENKALEVAYTPRMALSELVGFFGGKLIHRDEVYRSVSVTMLARAERDFDVFLSSNIARDSARYLVAEQIGHYVVHYLDVRRGQHEAYTVDTVYAAKPASSELAATEAVWFASAFLMPSGLVDDFCSERTRTVTQVADEFDVSAMTAQNRLRRLQRLAADGVTTLGVHEGHASLIYSA